MRGRYRGKTRIAIMLVAFVAVLVIVGILMQSKMQTLLRSYVEKQVTEQAKILGEVLEAQVDAELKSLENIAACIQAEAAEMDALLAIARSEDGEASWGILELDGNVICGDALDTKNFKGIQNSFRGNKAVSYKEGEGVLFTVPVFHGTNIKYVLYKFCEEEQLVTRFGRTCYEGEGRLLVASRDEQIVVPYIDWNESDREFLESQGVQETFMTISDKMNIASAAASYYDAGLASQYLFVSDVGEYDFILVGVVAEDVAAEGISYIVTLVLWVFGLLLLLLAIGMAFLFGAEEKARESDELRAAKVLADSANRAKTDFLANMSHEIRTPINAVMGMNEMILRECEDESIREYALNIQSASKNLLSLINDVLDLSKIEAGKMEIVEDKYKLSAVLNDVVNMIQIKAEQKGLAFHVKVDETLPDKLIGDEVRIRQVVVNILNNAVKYTKSGSVCLDVARETAETGVLLKIAVKDTGIGIREEDMGRLFSDFERLDLKENRAVEGSGLGLSITSKMVKLMNGRIEVESVYGQGSTFTVYLPQKVSGTECIGNFEDSFRSYMYSTKKYHESFVAPEANVLVVDDNEMNLFVVKSFLKKTQIRITCCNSGEGCLKQVAEKPYDVILLDHMMPGMDGIETLKHIRAMESSLCKDIPIIALTANAILGVREMYLSEGFTDYLSKPIDGEKLEEILRNYLPEEKLIIQQEKETTVEKKPDAGEQISNGQKEVEAGQYIDISTGMQYSADSEEMYHEFLKMFCDMKEDKMSQIEECYAKEDWNKYAVLVHALKSTSLSIGGKTLSEMMAALEKAGKGNDADYIKEHHRAAMNVYIATVQEGWQILGDTVKTTD